MIDILFDRYPSLLLCREEIEKARDTLIHCFQNGGKLLLCGNGGSAADCGHVVGELMKGFMKKRPMPTEFEAKLSAFTSPEQAAFLASRLQGALPAISLNAEGTLVSAFGNDVCFETAFAQGVVGYGKEGDILLCLSTSGNSKNCVAAATVARAMGLTVLSLTGAKESALSAVSSVTVRVPETETYRVQELHLPIYHALCAEAEAAFFTE